jgi:hypothetical protein
MEQIAVKFREFVSTKQIDSVSTMVLRSLVQKYIQGDKDSLFGKMVQLEDDELFSLCEAFKKCFDYIGLNDEFVEYKQTQNNH